jgi:signal transduction histidine kinase
LKKTKLLSNSAMPENKLRKERIDRSPTEQIILGVAHELNNPNTFVRMNAANIKKMLKLLAPVFDEYEQNHPERKFGPFTLSELRAKLFQLNESTLQATVRLIAIADKLKQSMAASLERASAVDLGPVLSSVVSAHGFLIERIKSCQLDFDHESTFMVLGHSLQLEQAFSILLTNATDAIHERHKDGASEAGQLVITLGLRTDGQLQVNVSDNGCGMTPEVEAKVFDPYFTTKPHGVGDGLGLPLCKAIVERHGGSIGVSSESGKGTTVAVILPAAGQA